MSGDGIARGMTAETYEKAAPAADQAAAGSRRIGAIVLARHGEPALSRKVRLNAAEYRAWWATYEEAGLLESQVPPSCILDTAKTAKVMFASTRRRSIESATSVAAGKTFTPDDLFIEAPLPPPGFPSFIRLPPRFWGVIARFWWWFLGHHEGQETKAQAQTRARKATALLIEHAQRGEDVLLVAHGFFNAMIGLELERAGWTKVDDQGYRYWSMRRYHRQ